MIAVEPDGSLAGRWDAAVGRRAARAQGRPDADLLGPGPGRVHAAGARAVPLVRRRLEGQRRTARHGGLRRRHQFVRPEDVAESIPCGDSVDAVAEAAGAFFKAGFTDLALVQIGGTDPEQERFFDAAPELITALKETAG